MEARRVNDGDGGSARRELQDDGRARMADRGVQGWQIEACKDGR
jgi:hypothetical protein